MRSSGAVAVMSNSGYSPKMPEISKIISHDVTASPSATINLRRKALNPSPKNSSLLIWTMRGSFRGILTSPLMSSVDNLGKTCRRKARKIFQANTRTDAMNTAKHAVVAICRNNGCSEKCIVIPIDPTCYFARCGEAARSGCNAYANRQLSKQKDRYPFVA